MPSPEFMARQGQALHVAYEVGQMVGAAIRIDSAPDDVTHNALLESTLLHARSLIDFLLNGGRKTDIRGSTLLPGWEIEAEHRQGLEDRKLLLDKHLAHLTPERVSDGKQHWPHPEIVNELVGHLRRYHTRLPHDSQARFSIGFELQRVDAALAEGWDGRSVLMSTTNSSPVITVNRSGHTRLTLSDFVD
jgi:hypothetical protein